MKNETRLPDHIKKLEYIILEADTICDLQEQTAFLSGQQQNINESLSALETAGHWEELGCMLNVLKNQFISCPISLFSPQPSLSLCKGLQNSKAEISNKTALLTIKRAKALKKNAEKPNQKKYTNRHRFIELSIRLIWELFDASDKWPYEKTVMDKKEACSFIADCYLLRSKLALPKGSKIPEKKVEALLKAWKWAKQYKETDDLKIEIALELDRWDKNRPKSWIENKLHVFLNNNELDFTKLLHWVVNDRARNMPVKMSEENYDKMMGVSCKSGEKILLPFYQARAAFRTCASDLKEKLEKAVEQLERLPLSHYLWDDTIDLLSAAAKDSKFQGTWKNAAIKAWKKCKEAESRLKLSLQVRWYWARHRELYDLAFKAAIDTDNLLLAADITDLQKSRPTIKQRALERYLTKKGDKDMLRKISEIEAKFATDNYIQGIDDIKSIPCETFKPGEFLNIPDKWAAIHFNIAQNKTSHALIFENNNCQVIEINISDLSDLWDVYKKWKTDLNDYGSNVQKTNKALIELCSKEGCMLSPVMEKVQSENIIFIPHGFLHLVPLHASIINNKYLFEDKNCLFLPAWSMAIQHGNVTDTNGNILLTNWKSEKLINDLIDSLCWNNKHQKENTPEDFFSSLEQLESSPDLLAIFSHGQGNYSNPYNSAFLMNGAPLTHQAIIQGNFSLQNTKVILTACESDLATGASELTDEHLSLASAFLRKGASEVAGALFKCFTDFSQLLIEKANKNSKTPLYKTLRLTQKDWLTKKPDELYKAAAFRTLGFPSESL